MSLKSFVRTFDSKNRTILKIIRVKMSTRTVLKTPYIDYLNKFLSISYLKLPGMIQKTHERGGVDGFGTGDG
ncbi:hypothetical protein BpJC4_13590 [Weizmannia acidilactici]|nr:hypothetical protein BpJC4_13590 [Weizmannia acidilactici]